MRQLRSFFELALERKLAGSDQLLYLHIFNKFNSARFPERLRVKDAELKGLMRLHEASGGELCRETVRRAKQRLKSKGFLDFTSGGGKALTEYRLIKLYSEDAPGASPVASPVASPAASGLIPYSHTPDAHNAHKVLTDGSGFEEKGEEQKHSPLTPRKTKAGIVKVWESEIVRPVGESEQAELQELVSEFGFAKVKEAIIQTKKTRYYPTFADFKRVLGKRKEVRYDEPPKYDFDTHGVEACASGSEYGPCKVKAAL